LAQGIDGSGAQRGLPPAAVLKQFSVNGPKGAIEIAEPWAYIVGGGSALEFEEHSLDVLGIVPPVSGHPCHLGHSTLDLHWLRLRSGLRGMERADRDLRGRPDRHHRWLRRHHREH